MGCQVQLDDTVNSEDKTLTFAPKSDQEEASPPAEPAEPPSPPPPVYNKSRGHRLGKGGYI